jgi:hypothetical protein
MQEAFLHFLWQFQYFDKSRLQTADGRPIQVIKPGVWNTNAGPDFTQARVVVGGLEWAGNVELHLRSSDWQQHRHQHDQAYDNVILHVVWEYNQPIRYADGTEIPVVTLQPHTDKSLITKYEFLLKNLAPIPCVSQFRSVKDIHKRQALDKALMNRVQEKAVLVKELYQKNQQNWEETAYQLLVRNFGFKINSDSMLALAQSLPLKILHKHADSLLQLEALLFGQAGLIPSHSEDAYVQSLQREYQFLKHKYTLESPVTGSQWKFLRLRPANFPTLRIAQVAALLHQKKFLFSSLLSLQKPEEILSLMEVKPSAYWHEHYHFGKSSKHEGNLGKDSQHNILINSVVPLLTAYAEIRNEQEYIERAVSLLEVMPPEDNKITRLWKDSMGLPINNAFDSQACLELYNRFCSERKCLMCPVGVALLK